MSITQNKLIYWCHLNNVTPILVGLDTKSWDLQDDMDGNGAYISAWRMEIQQPTKEEIDNIDQTVADTWIDNSANLEKYQLENNFLLLCDSITQTTTHNKLSFEQLNAIIDLISSGGILVFGIPIYKGDTNV